MRDLDASKHGQPAVSSIPASGRNLRRLLRGKSSRFRGHVAGKLVTGEYQLVRPLRAQAARLCDVHPSYVGAPYAGRIRAAKPVTDAVIDHLITKHGADAFLRGLDRLTTPANDDTASLQAAE